MTDSTRKIEVGNVVQIMPDAHEKFGGCLLVVTEVKSWGVVGYVPTPQGYAPFRAKWDQFEWVGKLP